MGGREDEWFSQQGREEKMGRFEQELPDIVPVLRFS